MQKKFVDVHIKLHGIFEKLEKGVKQRIDEVIEKECLNTIRITNMLIQDPLQAQGQIKALKPSTNNFIMVQGEVVYNFKCKEIVANLDDTIERDVEGKPICYNSLKVRIKDEEMFVTPMTRILSKNAERVPCSDQFPIMFETREGNNWVKKDSMGITFENRPDRFYKMFAHPKSFNLTHSQLDFSEEGGIYSKQQLEQTTEFLNHRDTKRALESVYYFDKTGGKSLSHSEVKNEIGWSVLDWAQALGGFDVKKIINTIFSWIAGLAHTYMAGKFIFSIITMCCCITAMPGNSAFERIMKIFQFRSKGYMASKISNLESSKGKVSQTDIDLLKLRLEELEKGRF